jgi:sigma-B regulation protein RsbU (phosphoserine phosphatase)
LFPKLNLLISRFEIFGISNPTDEVGGDLVDFLDNETTHTFYIADVSGHGVAAGSMMGMFKSTIRVLLNKDVPLGSILNDTSTTMYNLKKKNMFLTCAAIKFNSNYEVEYTTAGHLPVLKLSNHSDNFEELLIKQVPIAAIKNFNYTTSSTEWKKNDLFVLLTDGITETLNKKGEYFGMEKVKQIILNNRNDELSNIYEKINNELVSFGKQNDDQTIFINQMFIIIIGEILAKKIN